MNKQIPKIFKIYMKNKTITKERIIYGFKIVNSLSKKQELYRLFGFFHSAFLCLLSLVLVDMGKMWLESGIIDFYIWTLKKSTFYYPASAGDSVCCLSEIITFFLRQAEAANEISMPRLRTNLSFSLSKVVFVYSQRQKLYFNFHFQVEGRIRT